MGSVNHVVEGKKELVKYLHRFVRLGVRLEDSAKGDFMVHHNSESFVVVEMKSKKHLYPLLMQWNELMLSKSNEPFFQGGMKYLSIKVGFACRM